MADEDMEDALNESMAKLSQEIAKPLATHRVENSGKQVTDYDRLMATGARLLKEKVDEHMREVSAYELQRIELIDSYRVRMERLKIEAEEQLRNLEQTHIGKLEALEKLISKLRTLREA